MDCLDCSKEMELTDTTYSNINTLKAVVGDHTGDIYFCEHCDKHFIDDFLCGYVREWNY